MSSASEKERQSRPRLECDLIMKGGITSGIVYPKAIHHLSRYYRFRSIGGASAGAIAAALCAAAEFGRTQGRDPFADLDGLPQELGATQGGKTKMLSLFAPDPATRSSFHWLLSFLDAAPSSQSTVINAIHRTIRLSMAAIWRFPLIAILAAFVSVLIAWPAISGLWHGSFQPANMLGPLLSGLVGFVLMCLVGAAWCTIRALHKNDLGLVCGRDSLTQWLHDKIQAYSGQLTPLTFGDLWGGADCASQSRDIDLRMMTTCLSHGRGYCFPLEPNVKLYFSEKELRRLFPEAVVSWMKEHQRPSSDAATDQLLAAAGLYRLPRMRDLPIVVVTRMSLSFPVLLCPVPLWEQQFGPVRGFRRLWFSDGGIISNFPIHLFDSLIPSRPTFGITLTTTDQELASDAPAGAYVRLPREFKLEPDSILPIDKAGQPGLFSLVGALWNTIHGWVDRAQQRVPGFKERVASVALAPGEGGLNLRMQLDQIRALADRGLAAAKQLVLHYHPALQSERDARSSSRDSKIYTTWAAHRWVRYRTTGMLLEEALEALLRADEKAQHSPNDLRDAHEAPTSYPLDSRKRPALETYQDLLDLAKKLRERRHALDTTEQPNDGSEDRVPGDDGIYGGPNYPRPRSRLRILPRD